MKKGRQHIYGPVASRRLGASLGVDLVPPKTCDYDCVYCQLGRTSTRATRIAPYVKADDILAELKPSLESGTRPDYITMAGSGEPTLNSELAQIISRIKEFTDIPVAVLTNGSLLGNPAVSRACLMADLVLPSLDAGDEDTFQRVNRPCAGLRLRDVVDGLAGFRSKYHGTIWLEVMLLEGLNSSDGSVKNIGELIEDIAPDEVHLNTVIRPPAEPFARPVPEERVQEIVSILRPHASVLREVMRGEGESAGGSISEGELLALIERRPCTRGQIADTFNINEIEALKVLSRLVAGNRVISELTGGEVFYRVLQPAFDDRHEE